MHADRQPKRTCIGCRGVFEKNAVIRVVAGPAGAMIDYREKLPGRAAYVCPRPECIQKALGRENLSRALHASVSVPDSAQFLERLQEAIVEKVRSLLSMAARAGMLASGASAVEDALQKGRAEMIVFAGDIAEGTKDKLVSVGGLPSRVTTLLTRDEMGKLLGRELVGVVAILEKGFAHAVWNETERLKGLRNKHL
jgi:predicted RNA-binding protein YlxR (DUF448 family)